MKNSLNWVPLATQKQLLLLAGIVWSFAGFQIFKIGFQATKISELPFIYFILLALLIFIIFLKFIFGNMVLKHKLRIESYETKMPIYHFFDKKRIYDHGIYDEWGDCDSPFSTIANYLY
ncbi:MAG: hypothetical protein RR440_03200 [Erysipelotrichaceae bacterium]